MIKIVYIFEAGGGVRKHVSDLLQNIDLNKYEVYVIYNDSRLDKIAHIDLTNFNPAVNFIKVTTMNRDISLINDMKAIIQVFKIIKQIKPEIVHCHSSKAGLIGRISAKIASVKAIVYTPHAYIMQNQLISVTKRKIYRLVESLMSKLFTTVTINVSEGERKFAIENKLDDYSKFEVILNGLTERSRQEVNICVDRMEIKKRFEPFSLIPDSACLVGLIARFDNQKDPLCFIDIAVSLCQKIDNVYFCYVGDGPFLEESRQRVKESGLEKRIMLPGFSNKVEEILDCLDIYLITSRFEGLPYSLIEALRNKLPIVATNAIGNNEIVTENFNGYLFPISDVKSGVTVLESMINNNQMLSNLGENSYKVYLEKYTLDKMLYKTFSLYDKLLL